eukprot:5255298-Pyramimonas_sp.AAC.1
MSPASNGIIRALRLAQFNRITHPTPTPCSTPAPVEARHDRHTWICNRSSTCSLRLMKSTQEGWSKD